MLRTEDLKQLLGVEESYTLEFKRKAYDSSDEEVRQMLRDVASLANAAGGHLLLGVDTDAEERATALCDIPNAANEAGKYIPPST